MDILLPLHCQQFLDIAPGDANGWAPIHKAAYEGKEDCLVALSKGKASLMSRTSSGLTAIMIAKEQAASQPDKSGLIKGYHRLQALEIQDDSMTSIHPKPSPEETVSCQGTEQAKGAAPARARLVGHVISQG